MNAYTPEVEQEIDLRSKLIQQVIDRMIPSNMTSIKFVGELQALIQRYPDNERPLDSTAPRLIQMNGEIVRPVAV